jgi:hypothetical protein
MFLYDLPEHGFYRVETTHPLTHPGTSAMLGEMINVIFIVTALFVLVEPKPEGEEYPTKHSY